VYIKVCFCHTPFMHRRHASHPVSIPTPQHPPIVSSAVMRDLATSYTLPFYLPASSVTCSPESPHVAV
jgi:hypothetical protein